jgi:hypothetical protein
MLIVYSQFFSSFVHMSQSYLSSVHNMSLSWSDGNYGATFNIIIAVFSSLKDSSGPRSEYQELVRDLRGFKIVLQHIDNLEAEVDLAKDTYF